MLPDSNGTVRIALALAFQIALEHCVSVMLRKSIQLPLIAPAIA